MPDTAGASYMKHAERTAQIRQKYRQGMLLEGGKEGNPTYNPDYFPGRFAPWSERVDTHQAVKRALAGEGQNAGAGPMGVMHANEHDIDYVTKKFLLGKYLEDLRAFGHTYDLSDPAQVEIAKRINSEYFDLLEEEIDARAELDARLGKIMLRGIQSWDDWLIVAAVLRDEIKVPETPVWLGKENKNTDTAIIWHRGMFNPLRHSTFNTVLAAEGNMGNPLATRKSMFLKNIMPGFKNAALPNFVYPKSGEVKATAYLPKSAFVPNDDNPAV